MTDSEDVSRTLYRYCRMLDDRDLERLGEVYAADAVDDRRRGTPLTGLGEIRAYFERAWETVAHTAHLLSNVEIDVDGDTATAYSRVTAYHWLGGGDPVRAADFVLLGTYDDELARTPNGWRVARRLVGSLGPAGLSAGTLPAVFAGFGGA